MAYNTYIIGQVVVLQDVITDPAAANALVDDPTDVVTVYRQDGTTVSPAPPVNRLSLGTYTAQVTIDQDGWWEYVFKSTGAGAGARRGRFYVSPVP